MRRALASTPSTPKLGMVMMVIVVVEVMVTGTDTDGHADSVDSGANSE